MIKINRKRKLKRFARAFAKLVRVITVAPIPAAVMFAVIYANGNMASSTELVWAILTISLLPLAAYPLQTVIPHFKSRGREGQRTLAMIMSTAGYIIAVTAALILNFSSAVTTVFVTYLLSGVLLLIINKAVGFKASGHACGLAGPMGVLAYFTGPAGAAFGIAVFLLVLWSSLKLHSHTLPQYVVGALIPNLIFYTIILLL